jgi:hypothetical protein
MSSSLFLKPVDPHSFFEKQASIAKMPDDDTKWPAQVLSSLHQQLPFLSQYEIDLDMQRIEPEAGFAFGHALLMAKNDPTAATASKNPQNMVRIPIIVADRLLQPFHTFELAGNVYPLTAERIESALLNPSMFQGPADQPQRQKSLIDQMYPPYQQRQGFGRVVGDGASSMGINKLSSAFISQYGRVVTKLAGMTLSFSAGSKLPASVVLKNSKVKLPGGTSPQSFSFYQMGNSKFVMAVPASIGSKLESTKDQSDIRKIIAPLMREELTAGRSGRGSQGMLLLFTKKPDGSYAHVPPPSI